MTRDAIERVAERVDLPVPLVEYVLEKSGQYIHHHLKNTDISRFVINNFGTWRVNLVNVNNEIKYMILPVLKYAKRKDDKEFYERIEAKFKYLWALRQSAIQYKLRKNAKYYGERAIKRE